MVEKVATTPRFFVWLPISAAIGDGSPFGPMMLYFR